MRFKQDNILFFQSLKKFALATDGLEILTNTQAFKTRLFELIQAASQRIYLSMLYLEDDEAGREVLHALYQAKQQNPALDVKIFVDFHRAQRGLIGEAPGSGNAKLYRECQQQYQHPIDIYGVPVKSKEVMGVLHLKGFIFDDTVLFSGASINDIYLHQLERYRYDRYHVIHHQPLAQSMVDFLEHNFITSTAVQKLTNSEVTPAKKMKKAVVQLKRQLSNAQYHIDKPLPVAHNGVAITPLAGLGSRRNILNKTIQFMIRSSQEKLVMLTPYFNLPPVLNKEIRKLLKKGRTVTMVIGDKTANDFFIPPDKPFTTIGGLPYVYETNLRRFLQKNQKFVNSGLLNVHLWSHENNSFHLKGINSDDKMHLLTGNNLNPRAWRLDLENGLLIQDQQKNLLKPFADELTTIMTHTQRVEHFKQIESIKDYPPPVRKLLRKLKTTKIDSIIKNII
ncbi:MAG: CDP-diacylglycerol--serine O-phosphatidyltransferase [Phenylobacterium sp.]|jgi:CDP-diacylglycerol--serine O-phosphatidyltransferase